MGLVKEPKGIDFLIQSEPWTDKELVDFRKIMKLQKGLKNKGKILSVGKTKEYAFAKT